MNNQKCIAKNVDGSACDAYALSDSDLCWAHEPKLEEKRKLAHSMGGRNIQNLDEMKILITNTNDVMIVISEVISNLRSMPLSINQAKAILDACEVSLHGLELQEFSTRIARIENQLGLSNDDLERN